MAAPVVVAVAGAAVGAASGVGLEFILSRGKADRGDYVLAGALGAAPGGLGVRGTVALATKVSRLRYFSRSAGDDALTVATGYLSPRSRSYIGPELVAITSGMAGGYVIGQLYDHFKSRGGEHTSRSGTPSAGLSTPGPSAPPKDGPKPSSKPRRSRSRSAVRVGPRLAGRPVRRSYDEEILEKYYSRRR